MRRIYLDCNATAPLCPEALAAIRACLDAGPGNAGSVHAPGQRARMAIEGARAEVAALVGAHGPEVVFTSSGTEANNLALHGMALAAPPGRRRIVSSAFEHPSVDAVLVDLATRGFDIVRVRPGSNGCVDAEEILDAATDGTLLVSLMLANHEIGTLQPVAAIGAGLARRGVPLHTDAVQAAGKVPVSCDQLGAGLVTLAAHKLGGPQGAGALVIREGIVTEPLLRGGGQEQGRRPGTENVAAIAGFGAAALAARTGLVDEARRMAGLRDRLETGIAALDGEARVNGRGAPRVPNTTSLYFPGTEAEALVMALDLEGLSVSAGAACSSGTLRRSPSLLAMGLEREAAASIRVSLGPSTTAEEIDAFLGALPAILDRARRRACVPAGTVSR